MPRLVIITPIGPGHETIVERAKVSVRDAHDGQWTEIKHCLVEDGQGQHGRSHARNIGIDKAEAELADWLFFLDADDRMMPNALTLNDFAAPATFGSILLDGQPMKENVWPCTWADVVRDPLGTLSMGCFVRADLGLRFDETLDAGEDFDFYLRLPGFTKRQQPLVDIGYSAPSAGGPRGYTALDWTAACRVQVRRALEREPGKFQSR